MTVRSRLAAMRALIDDRRGVTIVEFAIVAPVLCILLFGALDLAHTLYLRTVLQGVVQKASRDSTLESSFDAGARAQIDDTVRNQVTQLGIKSDDIQFSRRFYRTYAAAAAARPEEYTDTNSNGRCDNGEPFTDRNNNGVWDADGGDSVENSGAKDRTIYTVTVVYPRLFPIYSFIGGSDTNRVSATTVWENQPFAEQASYGAATTGSCT